jgi:hypothetical protein
MTISLAGRLRSAAVLLVPMDGRAECVRPHDLINPSPILAEGTDRVAREGLHRAINFAMKVRLKSVYFFAS